jgi:hypothetical protein
VDAEFVAAIASVIAAVLAALGFLYGVFVRWPRLSVEWRAELVGSIRGPGESGESGESYCEARVEIANVGGSSARDADVIIELDGIDGLTLFAETVSIAPDEVWREDVKLQKPTQAVELPDRRLDLHGRALRACVTYRWARFLPVVRACGEYDG